MTYKTKAYSIWECGKRRDKDGNPHQEDNIFPAHGMMAPTDRLYILCDGMGGHDSGEVASATVCQALSQSVMAQQPDAEGEFSDEIFLKALDDAYQALDAADTGAKRKMGTTLTFLKLHSGGATVAHMGDSRIYHIRPGSGSSDTRIMHVTRDHSLINDLLRVDAITEEEARTSPQRNIITRAMQPNLQPRCKAEIAHIDDIRPGDYFYLCSDGMLERMEDEEICAIFSPEGGDDEQKVVRLTEATADNGDNHTAIIVHVLDVDRKSAPATFQAKDETPCVSQSVGNISHSEASGPDTMVSASEPAAKKTLAPWMPYALGAIAIGVLMLLFLLF